MQMRKSPLTLRPSVGDCIKAETVFAAAVQRHRRGNAPATVIRCALAAVWSAGRAYQLAAEMCNGDVSEIDSQYTALMERGEWK